VGKRLYVGNLPFTARDQDLQDAFSAFGEVVSARVMTERETGRSKGFGFVEMSDDAQSDAAVQGMHGQALGGRTLVVNEARPQEARPPRTGGFGGGGGGGYGGPRGGGGGYGGGGSQDGRFRSPYGAGPRTGGAGGGTGYGGGGSAGGRSYRDDDGQ
jgi:cold-inducible RNA-binding protein